MEKKLLGKKINLARKDRGLTGEKLSELCGINATYLRQIESGAKTPSLPLFISLCRELRVSPSYLLKEILPTQEVQEMEELWERATPKQAKLIQDIVRSVLEYVEE